MYREFLKIIVIEISSKNIKKINKKKNLKTTLLWKNQKE